MIIVRYVCGTGVWSDDGDGRRSDVRRRRQLQVLLEVTRRNADGGTNRGVREAPGGVRDRRRFRVAGQLPRLLWSL